MRNFKWMIYAMDGPTTLEQECGTLGDALKGGKQAPLYIDFADAGLILHIMIRDDAAPLGWKTIAIYTRHPGKNRKWVAKYCPL